MASPRPRPPSDAEHRHGDNRQTRREHEDPLHLKRFQRQPPAGRADPDAEIERNVEGGVRLAAVRRVRVRHGHRIELRHQAAVREAEQGGPAQQLPQRAGEADAGERDDQKDQVHDDDRIRTRPRRPPADDEAGQSQRRGLDEIEQPDAFDVPADRESREEDRDRAGRKRDEQDDGRRADGPGFQHHPPRLRRTRRIGGRTAVSGCRPVAAPALVGIDSGPDDKRDQRHGPGRTVEYGEAERIEKGQGGGRRDGDGQRAEQAEVAETFRHPAFRQDVGSDRAGRGRTGRERNAVQNAEQDQRRYERDKAVQEGRDHVDGRSDEENGLPTVRIKRDADERAGQEGGQREESHRQAGERMAAAQMIEKERHRHDLHLRAGPNERGCGGHFHKISGPDPIRRRAAGGSGGAGGRHAVVLPRTHSRGSLNRFSYSKSIVRKSSFHVNQMD